MAFDHALCRAVLAVAMRALTGSLRRRAAALGVAGGRSGMVTAIQRCGSALNINVHFHTLAVDGVFADDATGALVFHPLPSPERADVAELVATIGYESSDCFDAGACSR